MSHIYRILCFSVIGLFFMAQSAYGQPSLQSAVQDNSTTITVTYNQNVQTNGTNPTDFTVEDGQGTGFAVSAQADGTGGDTDIVLTVADMSTAVGDIIVTYTDNNNEISDAATGLTFAATDATGVEIDLDATPPTMASAVQDNSTTITVTFSEDVQTNGTNPTDFTVVDGQGTGFAVSAQADVTPNDADIVLTVADMTTAVGDIRVTYSDTNIEISDFGSNDLVTDGTGVVIDLDATLPTLVSAVQTNSTTITLTLSELVQTNGTDPTDFTVLDGESTGFAVSAQADGTGGDTDIVLTVADMSTASGDVTITYTNGTSDISDFGGNSLATDGAGVMIDDVTAPTLVSAVQTNSTTITLTLSEDVQTNGTDPTDFTVVDGQGTGFAVSAQADGTGGDTDIVLTVADMSTAVGDITVTYSNGTSDISDFGGNSLATDATGVIIDLDATSPTMASAVQDNSTTITVTFSEDVQTNGTNPTDFTVVDGQGTGFAVSAQADVTPNDADIVLTVADMTTAVGDIRVTYSDTNIEISDFGSNDLVTDGTGVVIDLDATLPTLVSAVQTNSTTITLTMSELVQTNGTDPTDFTVLDGESTGFAVSAQADGTGGDTDIVLTVADMSTASGDVTITYSNGTSDISDFGGNSLATDGTGVVIDDVTAPTLVSAVQTNSTTITLTLSEDVQTNGTDPTDFTVVDGQGTGFAVSAQADGTGGDTDIVLTVADMSTAVGDITVTYSNGTSDISDFGGNSLATDATGVIIDLDATSPTMASAVQDNITTITVTFSEDVQTNGTNPTDFTVVDGQGTGFAVSAQADVTPNDADIVLTVADMTTAVGDIRVTYSDTNTEISDFGSNDLVTDGTGVVIDLDATLPTLVSAVQTNSTTITLTMSELVQTNGTDPTDFTVLDGESTGFAVSAQADGTGGDTDIVLTLADMTAAVGDITVTYSNGTSDISDFGGNSLATDATGVEIDLDNTAPQVASIVRQTPSTNPTNQTSVTFRITFNEPVQNVDLTDFEIQTGGKATGSLSSVTPNSTTEYDVLIVSVLEAGDGELDLDFAAGQNIEDFGSNSFAVSISSEETYDIDQTNPTVTDLEIFDTDDDGFIDRIDITFSENIDTDNAAVPVFADLGTLTLPDGSTVVTTNATPSITDTDGTFAVVSVTGISLLDHLSGIANTAIGSTGIDGLTGLWVDNAGNAILAAGDDAETVTDSADPILIGSSPANGAGSFPQANDLIFTFSENVFIGSGNITIDDVGDDSDDRTIAVGDAQVTFSTNTLTINPTSDLEIAEDYDFLIPSSAIEDVAGNTYAGLVAAELSFTTGAFAPAACPSPTYPTTGSDINAFSSECNPESSTFSSLIDSDGEKVAVFYFNLKNGSTSAETFPEIRINNENTNIDWSVVIAAAELYDEDGGVEIADAINAADIRFESIATGNGDFGRLDATGTKPDGIEYALYIYFNTNTDLADLDGENLVFGVDNTSFPSSSGFSGSGANGGSATSGSANNEVTVIATNYSFLQQPTDIDGNAIMAPVVTLEAIDANGNRDLGYNASDAVQVTSTGTLSGLYATPTVSGNWVNGVGTVSDIVHTAAQAGRTLGTTSGALVDAPISTTFEVLADNTAPDFVNAHFFDTNGDGSIDEIAVEMTEDVDESSIVVGEFSLTGGTVDAAVLSASANNGLDATDSDLYFTLQVTLSGTSTQIFGYSGTTLDDDSNNPVSANASINTNDLAAPIFVAAHFFDVQTIDGSIDEVVIEMSEDIVDASVVLADFLINGAAVTLDGSISNGLDPGTVDDQYFTFVVSIVGTGTATSSYTSGSLTDNSTNNNSAASNATINENDQASPFLINSLSIDRNTDGNTDAVELEFSESIKDITFSLSIADWEVSSDNFVSGLQDDAVTFATAVTTLAADTDFDDQYVSLRWTPANTSGTSTIHVNYTNSSDDITDNSINANAIADITGYESVDGAAAVFVSSRTNDSDGNGQIDEVIVQFSDPINVVATLDEDATGGFDDFSVSGGYTITAIAPLAGAGLDDDEISLTITESGASDTDATPDVTLNGGQIDDIDGNTVAGNTLTALDRANPVFISSTTDDTDANGQIDEIIVLFSEDVDASTIDEISAGGFDDFAVTGYTITAVTPVAGTGVDDNEINLTLTESGSNDTGAVPNVTLNASQVDDLVGNTATTATIAAIDGAPIKIIDATWNDVNTVDGDIDQVVLTFSESVNVSDGLTADDFNGISINSGAITIDDDDYALNGTTTLTLNFDGSPITGTGISGLTIDYVSAGTNNIIEAGASANEMADSESPIANTDNATAIPTLVTIASDGANTSFAKTSENVQLSITVNDDFTTNTNPTVIFKSGGANINGTITLDNAGAPIYTVTFPVDALDNEGLVSFTLNFTDDGGNAITTVSSVTDLTSVTIDNTIPTVTILRSNPAGQFTNSPMATGVVFNVTFNEAAANVDAGDFSVTGPAGASITNFNPVSTTLYELTIGSYTADGTIDLNFNGGQNITDNAANAFNPATSITLEETYIIDQTQPTVALTDDHADAFVTDTDDVLITATFTETNTISASPTITIGSAVVGATMTSTADNKVWTYLWDLGSNSGVDGTYAVTISATDNTGNTNTAATAGTGGQISYEIDNTAPTATPVTISSNRGAGVGALVGDEITLGFSASQALSANPVVTFRSGGGIINDVVTINNPGGNNYTATYTVSALDNSGNVTFTLDFIDAAGNEATQVIAVTDGSSVSVDAEAPEVNSIDLTALTQGSTSSTTQDNVQFTIEFSEAISPASFSYADDITTNTNGSVAVPVPTVDFTSNPSIVLNFTGFIGDGDFSFNIRNDGATPITDGVGNTIPGSGVVATSEEITFDNTAPAISILAANTPAAGSVSNTSSDVVSFDIAFDQVIDDATFDEGDITLDITGGATINGVPPNGLISNDASLGGSITILKDGDNQNYTISIANVAGDGTVGITLAGSGIQDVADNFLGDGAGVNQSSATDFTIDNTAPTLDALIISSNNTTDTGHAIAGEVVTLTMNFDDDLSSDPSVSFRSGSVAVNGGVTYDEVSDFVIDGDEVWTATYTVNAGDINGDVDFTLSYTDDAGNSGTALDNGDLTSGSTVEVDKVAPTLTSVSLLTNNGTDDQHATAGDVVTLSFTSDDELSASPTVSMFINGTAVVGGVSVNTGSAPNYTATFTVDGTGSTVGTDLDDEGLVTFSIDFIDDAGNNNGTDVTTVTNSSSVEVDFSLPTLTSVSLLTSNSTDNQFARAGDVVTLSFTSDDDLSANPVVNIFIDGTAVVGGVTVNTGSAPNYTATFTVDGLGSTVGTDIDDEGAVSFSISFVDDAGNNGTNVTAVTNASSVEVDFTAPTLDALTISSGTAPNDHAMVGEVITLTMDFDDNLASAPSVSFRSGSVPVQNSATINGANDLWTAVYTVDANDFDGDVDFTLTYTDDAGNSGTTANNTDLTSGTTVEVDKAKPTVTFTDSQAEPSNTSPIVVTATFDEDVTGLVISDLTVTNGSISSLTGTGSVYTINITPDDPIDANVGIVLNASAVIDDAGNTNDVTSIYNVDYDNIAPVITSSVVVQGREITLTTQLDEPGTVYYVVVANGTSVTSAEVIGVNGAASSPVASGSISFTTGGINIVENITLDADRTDYELFLVSEDNVDTQNSLSTPQQIAIKSGGVTINTPSVTDICLEGDFFAIPDIVVTETIETDFNKSASNRTIVLELPNNFVFQDAGSVMVTGGEVIIVSSTNNAAKTTLTITYTVSDEVAIDVITISSLEVQALGTSISSNISVNRTGGNGDVYGINDENSAIPAFIRLTTIAPFDAPEIVTSTPATVTDPYILETDSLILGDFLGDGVTVYDKSFVQTQGVANLTPMTIGTVNASDNVNIYSDEDLTTLVLNLNGSTTYEPSLDDLGLTDASVGVNTFWIAVTDGNSCESAATEYGIAIIRVSNSASTTTFSDSDQSGSVFRFTYPSGSSAIFNGDALTSFNNNDPFASPAEAGFSVKYLPTTAGAGRDTLKYALTNESGQTANYWISLLVNSTDRVFELASVGNSGLCTDIGTFDFDVRNVLDVDFNGIETGSNPDFYNVQVFLYEDDARSTDITSEALSSFPSIVVNSPTSDTGWQLNLTDIRDNYMTDADYSLQLEVVMYTSDEGTGTISELSSEEVTIFRNPSVTFQNLTDGNFYCEDDELFDIEVEIISAAGTITRNVDDTGYLLAKWNGSTYTNVFDSDTTSQPARLRFEDLNTGDSTAYRLSYTSAEYTNAGCATTVTSTFTVYPKPEVRNLTLTADFSTVGDLDADGTYTFEYCEGDTFDGLSIALNEGDSVAWFRNAELTERIATNPTNGASITATNLFGSGTRAQGVENETFYYVIYENRNAEFDGCGSDAVAVNYIAYPTPDEPVVDTSSPNAYTSGTNEYEFNYCVDGGLAATIESINLDPGNPLKNAGKDYYMLLNSAMDTIVSGIGTQLIDISPYLNNGAGGDVFAGTSEIFYLQRAENDTTKNGTDLGQQFGGCASSLTRVMINVWDIPDAPVQSEFGDNPNEVSDVIDVITYYICAGEQLPDMSIAAPTGINDFLYEWFDANGDSMTIDDNQGDRLVDSDLELAFGANYRITDGTYSMTVQLNSNVREEASFLGCTSPTTRVDLVVLPASNTPEITAPTATSSPIPNEQFIYCVDFDAGLDPAATLEAEVIYTASAGYSNRIDWYRVNAAGDPVGNLNAAATGASVTASDLGIDGAGLESSTAVTLIFGVVHTSDLVDGYEEFGGCVSTTQYIELIVSPIADPQFGFDGIVQGETTTFSFFDDNSTDIDTDGLVFSVTGPDGGFTYESSDLTALNHVFTSAGVYTATMTLTTETGCSSERVRTFRILENIEITGVTTYDFNGNDGGWFTEFQNINGLTGSVGSPDNNSSWEHGTNFNSENVINSDADGGGGAWVTNLLGTYNNGEESFIYSPSYDLTGITNHAVSFFSIRNLEDNKDGVVFQLSVDNGDSWVTVGDFDGNESTGVEWYNASNIAATPGNNKPSVNGGTGYNTTPATNRVGWTDTDSNPTWVKSTHPLNFPDGSDLTNVRFRFALNSNANDKTNEGFGIDNFTLFLLGKTVLVEQFSSPNSKAFQDAIIGQIDRNEIMYINYMTDFATDGGGDILNERNPAGPAARAEYYEVSTEPQTVIDGDVFEQTDNLEWSVGDINLKELSEVIFDINNLQVNSVADNVINASATFQAQNQNDTTLDLSFYFAVVETSVLVNNITGTNTVAVGDFQPGDSILNVLRVLNPSPAGNNYEGVVTNGQEFNFTMNWEVTNVYDVEKLRIIAFVQSNVNAAETNPESEKYTGRVLKEVLQSAYVNVTGVAGNALGLEALSNFTIYPNPGDEEVTVEFEEVTRTEGQWIVFDQAGREVLKGIAGVGTKQLTIETKEMPSGIYLFHMYGEDNSRYAKRLIIVH